MLHQTDDIYVSLAYKEACRRIATENGEPILTLQTYDGPHVVSIGLREMADKVNVPEAEYLGIPIVRRFDKAYGMIKGSEDVHIGMSLPRYGRKDLDAMDAEAATPLMEAMHNMTGCDLELVNRDFLIRQDGVPYKVGSLSLDLTGGSLYLCSMVYCEGFPYHLAERVFKLTDEERENIGRNAPLNRFDPSATRMGLIESVRSTLGLDYSEPTQEEMRLTGNLYEELRGREFLAQGKIPGKVCYAYIGTRA